VAKHEAPSRRDHARGSANDLPNGSPPRERRWGIDYGQLSSLPSLGRDLLLAARPRQWAKNILVFGAPVTGGVLDNPARVAETGIAFIAFCAVASAVYYVNDLVDRMVDRAHPTKRSRPIADGRIAPWLAMLVAGMLTGGGLLVAFIGSKDLGLVMVFYVILTLAYIFFLRNMVLMDIAAIAGGFVLRAAAGGVAVDVPLSRWFLMVTSFGAIFVAAGRRHAEYVKLGRDRAIHRPPLKEYSEPYLRYIQYCSSTIAIAAYSLWAFEGEAGGSLWSALSIFPFVIAVFRYALLLDAGRGETPEDLVFKDRALQVLGTLWVLCVAVGVYLT
jgi:decaprenyl-phosphate phosphoribosyltransferase